MSNIKFKPRTYRVVFPKGGKLESSVTYEGFDRHFDMLRLERIALILDEGSVDAYALDVETTGHDFFEYLRETHPNVQFLGFFRREQLK